MGICVGSSSLMGGRQRNYITTPSARQGLKQSNLKILAKGRNTFNKDLVLAYPTPTSERLVQWLGQGHTTSWWQSQSLNPGLSTYFQSCPPPYSQQKVKQPVFIESCVSTTVLSASFELPSSTHPQIPCGEFLILHCSMRKLELREATGLTPNPTVGGPGLQIDL